MPLESYLTHIPHVLLRPVCYFAPQASTEVQASPTQMKQIIAKFAQPGRMDVERSHIRCIKLYDDGDDGP